MKSYHGTQKTPTFSYELRSYSTSHAHTQMANNNFNKIFGKNMNFKLKKGKGKMMSSSQSFGTIVALDISLFLFKKYTQ